MTVHSIYLLLYQHRCFISCIFYAHDNLYDGLDLVWEPAGGVCTDGTGMAGYYHEFTRWDDVFDNGLFGNVYYRQHANKHSQIKVLWALLSYSSTVLHFIGAMIFLRMRLAPIIKYFS